tara:strand:- start:1216 stop:2463 length:1248 start_codon:yes stop_codon:yes gene_type:complete
MAAVADYGLLVLGCAIGIGLGYLLAKNKYSSDAIKATAKSDAQIAALQETRSAMEAEMKNIAVDVSRQNSEEFLKLAQAQLGQVHVEASKDYDARKKEVELLVNPIKEHLDKLAQATTEMEKNREGAYSEISTMVKGLQEQTTNLRDTNVKLSTALRGSVKARGDWGQVALKNIAEAAGMLQHCDFDVEYTLKSGAGGARVDLLARIPDGGSVPVDAKVPLAAYWDGLDVDDPDARSSKMVEHAKNVKKHIDDLASRNYPNLIGGSDFTVMFIPAEPILSAAFEYEPTLQEYGFNKHVLIVTPVTLLALLRTVGLYWQQQSMAENAKEIHSQAREFYDRVAKFSGDIAKMGRGISQAVGAYNDAVASYDARIIPSGKKLEALEVTASAQRKVEQIPQVDTAVKNVKHLVDKSDED